MLRKIHLSIFCLFLTSFAFGQQTYLDTFSSVSYSNNNGTNNFSSNWIEVNEGGTSPSAGTIRVNSNQLRFRELNGAYIYRILDLTGASSATVSFDYNATSRGNEVLYVYLYNLGTGSWEFSSQVNASNTGTITRTLTAAQTTNTSAIAFASGSGQWNSGEQIFIDNVRFTATFDPTELPRPYEERQSINVQGNFKMRGNTNIECVSNCPASPDTNNPSAVMGYADVDSDGSTVNSSSSSMNLPAGASVEYAGLYWGGLYQSSRSGITNPPASLSMDEVKLRTPAGPIYTTITADVRNMERTSQSPWDTFMAYADVTSLVQSGGSGNYFVADIALATGSAFTGPNGGWTMVVIYNDPAEKSRNIAVWDGFDFFGFGANDSFTVTGLLTPSSGAFESHAGYFAFDGEGYATGDYVEINGTPLSNALNPTDNALNGTISEFGADVGGRNPNYGYSWGMDIDVFNTAGLVPNGANSLNVELGSSSEGIWGGVFVTSNEIAFPAVASKVFTPSTVFVGDESTVSITVDNPSNGVSLTNFGITDALPAGMTISSTPNASSLCGGTVTAIAGSNNFQVTGANLPAGSSCTFTFDIITSFDGTYTNTITPANISNDQNIPLQGETSGNLTVQPLSDNDSDGVADRTDLDDDNDGIPDNDELSTVISSSQNDCTGQTTLDFSAAATLISGTALQQGAVYRIPSVTTGTDALVTIARTNNAIVTNLDNNSSDGSAFRPQTAFNLTNPGDRGYIEYNIQFVNSGGTTPVVISKFFANFNDIDGNNNYAEQLWSDNPTSYLISNPTELTMSTDGSWVIGTAGTTEFSGAGNGNPEVNFGTVYNSQSEITVRVGGEARIAGATASGRQHNIEFSCLTNYNNPENYGIDIDSDGIANHLDLDSDNDGIYDAVEAGHNRPHTAGVVNGTYGANGLANIVETSAESSVLNYSLLNTDSTTSPDYQDTDSDDDGCSDANEAYADANADAGDNEYYGTGIPPTIDSEGRVTAATYPIPADGDGNGIKDYKEAEPAPAITTQPTDAAACPGANTSFTVVASNVNTYQWQIFSSGSWIDLSDSGIHGGTATATLTITNAQTSDNGNEYRVTVSNTSYICSTETSNQVTLRVAEPSVNAGLNQEICDGESVTLMASASGGTPGYTYLWNTGQTTASITFTPTGNPNANINIDYTITVTDTNGCQDTDTVRVRIESTPTATVNTAPASCGIENGEITFNFPDHPNRSGIEFSLDNQATYESNIADNSGSVTYSGLAAGSYDLWVRWGNNECPVNLGNHTISSVAQVTINTQPADQTVFVNDNATFSVSTSNADTYQWQVSTNGGVSFSNIMDGAEYSGTQTTILTVDTVEQNKNGYLYRVFISNSTTPCSAVTSNSALLTVNLRTVITNRRITYRIKKN